MEIQTWASGADVLGKLLNPSRLTLKEKRKHLLVQLGSDQSLFYSNWTLSLSRSFSLILLVQTLLQNFCKPQWLIWTCRFQIKWLSCGQFFNCLPKRKIFGKERKLTYTSLSFLLPSFISFGNYVWKNAVERFPTFATSHLSSPHPSALQTLHSSFALFHPLTFTLPHSTFHSISHLSSSQFLNPFLSPLTSPLPLSSAPWFSHTLVHIRPHLHTKPHLTLLLCQSIAYSRQRHSTNQSSSLMESPH